MMTTPTVTNFRHAKVTELAGLSHADVERLLATVVCTRRRGAKTDTCPCVVVTGTVGGWVAFWNTFTGSMTVQHSQL